MSQPMLEIKRDEDPSSIKMTANLLPCRIHHTGPVDPISAYWTPERAQDDSKSAYFRGRKLKGRTIALPQQYRGLVLQKQEDSVPVEIETKPLENKGPEVIDVDKDEEEEEEPRLGAMRVMAEFDEMVVWSHEEIVDAATDPYLRSVDEWLQVASKIHSYEMPDSAGK